MIYNQLNRIVTDDQFEKLLLKQTNILKTKQQKKNENLTFD